MRVRVAFCSEEIEGAGGADVEALTAYRSSILYSAIMIGAFKLSSPFLSLLFVATQRWIAVKEDAVALCEITPDDPACGRSIVLQLSSAPLCSA